MLKRATWVVLIAYMGVIFFLSVWRPPTTIEFKFIDKAQHVAAYLIMALLFMLALKEGSSQGERAKRITLAFAVCFIFGALMEGVQHFLPLRMASFMDTVANGIGAATGVFIFAYAEKRIGGYRDASS